MVPRKSDASSSRPDGPGTAADAWRGCRVPRACPGTFDPLDEARPAGPAQRTRRCSTGGPDHKPCRSPRGCRTKRTRTLGRMDRSPRPNRKDGRQPSDRRRFPHGAVSDRCGGLRRPGAANSGPPPSSASTQPSPLHEREPDGRSLGTSLCRDGSRRGALPGTLRPPGGSAAHGRGGSVGRGP